VDMILCSFDFMPHSEINGVIWLLDYLFTLAQNLAWVSFFVYVLLLVWVSMFSCQYPCTNLPGRLVFKWLSRVWCSIRCLSEDSVLKRPVVLAGIYAEIFWAAGGGWNFSREMPGGFSGMKCPGFRS